MALFEEFPDRLDEEHILILSAQKGDRQAFAVLVPLCALVLAWATRVFRRAVA